MAYHGTTNNRIDHLDGPIIALFNNGNSVKKIAATLGIARGTVVRVLNDHGIRQRNRSEAMFLRMASMSRYERKENARKAHDATRGVPKSVETKRKLAQSKSRIVGPGELEILEWLREAGIPVEHQAPIDIYNVDFRIGSHVAVELRTGGGHGFNATRFRKKVENLRESHLVVLIYAREIDALRRCKQKIIATLETASLDESTVGEEWMVRCDIKRFTRGHDDLGRFTAKPCPPETIYTWDRP